MPCQLPASAATPLSSFPVPPVASYTAPSHTLVSHPVANRTSDVRGGGNPIEEEAEGEWPGEPQGWGRERGGTRLAREQRLRQL